VLLLSDPIVAEMPAEDCGEDLVDLRQVPELLVDARKQDREGAWARLRIGVLTRLLQAQGSLPPGLQLLVIEGHRPAALQQHYFDGYRADLAGAHPDWSPERLDAEASKHVSPPSVAPHPCGAAVDLTLLHDGQELDLGTPVNATPEESANACFTAAENIPDTARAWRQVLGEALSGAGLVNYPPEWWHWSYGDRYWAAVTGAPQAIYTPR
jgi:D-alanyl-D-alanine dipeptidase